MEIMLFADAMAIVSAFPCCIQNHHHTHLSYTYLLPMKWDRQLWFLTSNTCLFWGEQSLMWTIMINS
jgi:hypothetical protein